MIVVQCQHGQHQEVFNTLTPCVIPTNLSSVPGWASATLDWDDVPGAWGYRVRYKSQGGSWSYDTVKYF